MCELFIGHILMFACGTTLSWSSPMLPKFGNITTSPFDRVLTSDEEMWISSLLPLGGAFGALFFTYLTDKLGRKRILLYTGIPLTMSYLLMAFGKIPQIFFFARFIAGLAVGAALTIIGPYVGELLHESKRGEGLSIGSTVCCGLVLSYSLGPFVDVTVFNLVLAIFPMIFLILFSIFGKEVPHYYILKKDDEQARIALKNIRSISVDIEEELKEIKMKYMEEKDYKMFDLFKTKGLLKAMAFSICLVIFQQFTGINMIMFYGQKLFEEIGSNLKPEICPIITGNVQLFSSLIAPIVGDRIGRTTLLTFSAIGMAISEATLGTYIYLKDLNIYNVDNLTFFPVILMVSFIFFFNCGYGNLCWPIIGELFPLRVKASVISIVAYIFWMITFFLTKYFAVMVELLGFAKYYWFFSGCCIMAAVFSKFIMIETRGKSLKVIQDMLNH